MFGIKVSYATGQNTKMWLQSGTVAYQWHDGTMAVVCQSESVTEHMMMCVIRVMRD